MCVGGQEINQVNQRFPHTGAMGPGVRYRDDEEDNDEPCNETTPFSTPSASSANHPNRVRRNRLPFLLALVATLTLIITLSVFTAVAPSPRKIVILMVSDGMGPASLSMARTFMQYTQDLEYSAQLPMDPFLIGTSRTRSHSSPPHPKAKPPKFNVPRLIR
jgi:hypothetical protein